MTKTLMDEVFSAARSRRDVNRILGSLGLAMVSVPVVLRPGMAGDMITSLSWTNYHIPELHPQFVKKYGKSPPVTYMSDDEDAFVKLRSGFAVDTAHPNTYSVGRWRDAELLRPVDVSRLSNWPDVFDAIKSVKGTQFAGEFYIVPCSWGNTSILYRTDMVDAEYQENPTWKLLWDERYKRRVAASNTMDDVVISTGLVAGVEDPFAMTDKEFDEVRELMRQQRDNLRYYWDNFTDMENSMAAGELVAAVAWNTSLTTLKAQGIPVAFITPKEGILTWLDGVVWVKAGEGPEQQVYDFMDAWISPEAGKHLIEDIGYGHTNRKSFEIADRARLAELGMLDPVDALNKGVFFQEIAPSLRERYNRMFEEVKAGY